MYTAIHVLLYIVLLGALFCGFMGWRTRND